MEDNNIIDLGEVFVPERWDDINLKKYQEIEKYYSDKDKKFDLMDVLDIIIDKDRDYLMSLPTEFLDIILEKLSFIQDLPKVGDSTNKIEISGETYVINVQNKLKTGEYIAVDTILKGDSHNYAAILAVLCRKEGEIYDSKFENEVIEDRIKMFEEQPITKILPLMGFFINCYIVLEKPSQLCSLVEKEIDLTQRAIRNSTKIGAFKRSYMIWQTKKLLKSIKSIKNT